MNIFEILFYQPVYNLLIVFYRAFGENLGLSIIAIGILSRLIMMPLTLKQSKMAESGRAFSEKSKEIKKKFKNDKEKQQQELLKLQQEYLPAQLGGCLPLIFQFIVFINIYNVIRNIISTDGFGFNKFAYSFVEKFSDGYEINTNFLGIFDLHTTPGSVSGTDLIPYLLLVIGVGIAQYFSVKVLSGLRNSDKKEEKKKKEKDKDGPEDFGEIMQRSTKQVMFIMPIFLMFVSFSLPSGLSIYLITTSLFVILQQVVYYRYFKDRNANVKTFPKRGDVIDGEEIKTSSKKKKKKKRKKKK